MVTRADPRCSRIHATLAGVAVIEEEPATASLITHLRRSLFAWRSLCRRYGNDGLWQTNGDEF